VRLFIEVPNWLGDAVMATGAIENLINEVNPDEVIILGSKVSVEIFKYHPKVSKIIINNSKEKSCRYCYLYKLAKSIGKVDLAVSFRQRFSSKFLLFFINAKKKCQYKRVEKDKHLVLMYNDFINRCLNINKNEVKPKIYLTKYLPKNDTLRPIVGINPGATYGSAKRWDEEKFAQISFYLSKYFDIIIFGGVNEVDIAKSIEDKLKELKVNNFINLAGKTSVEELINYISKLSLFITNDSGPMHIAASFDIPTVAIFGPTNEKETAPFSKLAKIVKKELDCSPCMKRECPMAGDNYKKCMKLVEVRDVLNCVSEVLKLKSKDLKDDSILEERK